jgi:hypothetical protein
MPVSSGRAAPAQAAFLRDAAAALRPDGLLAVNCVARADGPVRKAVRALQARACRAKPSGAHGVSGKALLGKPLQGSRGVIPRRTDRG